MPELLTVAAITVLAVISPGADFAMVTRNSYMYGQRAGQLSALGIALGVQVHVFYTMFGLAAVITYTPHILVVLRWLGAGYLIYIGFRTLNISRQRGNELAETPKLANISALRTGFLTNVLNPKTTLFVIGTYTQVVNVQTPLPLQFTYGIFMSFAHWLWFSAIALFFASERMRNAMLRQQATVNRVIGAVLMMLGASLAFSRLVT